MREKDFAVADIVFAFNNTRMTELLKERAKYLSVANFSKAKKTQKVMTMLKNIKYDHINVPNHFFITFMEGIAAQTLLR